jgi:hypothetical protein
MRRVFPVLAVLAVVGACRQTPDEPSAPDAWGPAPSGVRALAKQPSASAAPVASAPDAGPSPTRDFCNDAFTADADRMREKCSPADMNVSQSMARAAANLCTSDLHTALARSRAVFDAEAAGKCVEMLKQKQLTQSTETDTLFQHFPCDRVLLGLEVEGQPCRFSIECKDGLACVGYEIGVDGTCKKPPAVHEACTLQPYGSILNEVASAQHHPACGPGSFCDGTTCQARVPAGKPCGKSAACAVGLSCVDGKCGLRAGVGAPCVTATDCAFSLWCDRAGDAGAGKCAAKRPDGQDCAAADACKGKCDFPKSTPGHPATQGKCLSVCGSG